MQSLLLSSVAPFPRSSLDEHRHLLYPLPSPNPNWNTPSQHRPQPPPPPSSSPLISTETATVRATATAASTTTAASPRPSLRAPPLPCPYPSPPMSRSPPPPSENHLDTSLRGTQPSHSHPTSTTTTTSTSTNTTTPTATATATTSSSSSATASSSNSITHDLQPPILPPPPGERLSGQRWTAEQRRDGHLDRSAAQVQAQTRAQTQTQTQPQSVEQTHVPPPPPMPARLTAGSHLPDHQQPQPQTVAQSEVPSAPAAAPAAAPASGGVSTSSVDAVYLPLTPLTTSLPPRTTRRAKAHVPSACVNCKHKHLGCDPERPCRRCVASGKEATCKDVTHKKRGRPPLRAEESLMRHFETPFTLPDPSREPRVQMTPPVTRPNQHRRTSSSREIRPMTELRFPPPPPEQARGGGSGGGIPPHPPMWAPPTISSSPLGRPTSSQGDLPPGRPFSSGSPHHSSQPPPSPYFHSSPSGRPLPPPPAGQHLSPGGPPQHPAYLGFGPPIIHPTQQQQHQQSSLPAPYSAYNRPMPRSPHHPAVSEPPGPSNQMPRDVGAHPHSAESPADFRLPPIRSPSTSGAAPIQQHQQRRSGEIVPPPQSRTRANYAQAGPQSRPREHSDPYPQSLQPGFQATSASPNRPMTAHQLPPPVLPPTSLPPLSITSHPAEAQPHRGSRGRATTNAGNPDEETEASPRPAKRRKMTLGDMVNQ